MIWGCARIGQCSMSQYAESTVVVGIGTGTGVIPDAADVGVLVFSRTGALSCFRARPLSIYCPPSSAPSAMCALTAEGVWVALPSPMGWLHSGCARGCSAGRPTLPPTRVGALPV